MENDLQSIFKLLWTEIDFDDHPLHGGHGLNPEGNVSIQSEDDHIHVSDERAMITLVHPSIIKAKDTKRIHRDVVNNAGLSLNQHIIALTENLEIIENPPERVHPATLPISWINPELRKSFLLGNLLDKPMEKIGESASWREDLWKWRKNFSKLLPNWTWHLEFGNKSDRLGWYIRAPGNTLFTIFLGWGWLKEDKSDLHGFFLFERAPLGELDRDDEHDPNVADKNRTEFLFSEDGHLNKLNVSISNGKVIFDHAEIIHFESGLWPLVMGRAPANWDESEVTLWFHEMLSMLQPSIDYVSMT